MSAREIQPPPRFLAISPGTAPDFDLDRWLHDLAAAWLEAGGGELGGAPLLAVQVREKHLDDRSLLALLRRARSLLPPAVPVLVNGRPDLALAAGADGVHLPAAGLPVAPLRRCAAELGCRLLVGRSTHSAAEVAAARDEGADYVTFGPVHPTPSKAAYGPPPGIEGLRRAARLGVPVLALGGVDAGRLAPLADAGAHGAAAIRAFAGRQSAVAMLRGARHFSLRPAADEAADRDPDQDVGGDGGGDGGGAAGRGREPM